MGHVRANNVLVERLTDELLLYDQDRHVAFALEQPAAWLFEHGPLELDSPALAARASDALARPIEVEQIDAALVLLAQQGLLRRTGRGRQRGIDRRRLLLAAGAGCVISLTSPSVAEAASCQMVVCTMQNVGMPCFDVVKLQCGNCGLNNLAPLCISL